MNNLPLNFPMSELRFIDEVMRLYCDPLLVLDKPMLEHHLDEVRTRKETLLAEAGVERADVMSDTRLAELLTDAGIDPPMKWSEKQRKEVFAFAKTDETFTSLQDDDDEYVQALVAARLSNKTTGAESRAERLIGIASRGPMPFPVSYYAAHTGRLGGTDKINPQNFGRGSPIRSAIRAPAGHLLVAGDSSQIEARTVAYVAGQQDLVAAFARGEDIYCDFASTTYGRKITKANKLERFVGKTCILGLGFGMGPTKLQRTLARGQGEVKVKVEGLEAERLVKLYRLRYDRIPKLWWRTDKALKGMLAGEETRFEVGSGDGPLLHFLPAFGDEPPRIALPNGMHIRYPNLREENDELLYDNFKGKNPVATKLYGAKATENYVQALARIVVSDQWARIKVRAIKERIFHRSPIVGQVHDELIACVPEHAAQDMKALMGEEMSRAPEWAPGLPVACEVKVGETYGDVK